MGAGLLLLLALSWPFHHKHQPVPPTPPVVHTPRMVPDVLLPRELTDNCYLIDSTGEVYYYGLDGAVGVGANCFDAFSDWRREPTHIPKVSKIKD